MMYQDNIDEIKNSISEEMGSTYVTISQAWDSENNYNTDNITLENELMMLDAASIVQSLSLNSEGQLLSAGQQVMFSKDGTTYKPKLQCMLLRMNYRLAIASFLLKKLPSILPPNHDKDWTIYHVKYKSYAMIIGVLNDGKACFFNIKDKETLVKEYYDKQFQLRTKTKSMDFELEVEHPVYGDQITGFPMKLDELSDELDDMIDKICRMKSIPELRSKIDELRDLLDM